MSRWLFQRARNARGRMLRVRRDAPRKRTIAQRLASHLDGDERYPDELAGDRPVTRGDCIGGERPCPFVTCKHHMFLDVNPETGSITLNFPTIEPWDLVESCALDLAERGGMTLDDVGETMNLTRERIRQIEVRGLFNLRAAALAKEIA